MKKTVEEGLAMGTDETEFEAAVVRALERRPEVRVPAEFAARVRASLPLRMPVRRRRSVGYAMGVAAAAALVAGVCWLAPQTAPSFGSAAFDVELALLAELAGVALWLSMRQRGR